MKLAEKKMTVKQEEEAITYTMMAEPKVKVTSQYALSKFSGNDLHSSSRKVTTALGGGLIAAFFYFFVITGQNAHIDCEANN